jgi:GTP-binding protein YchF
MKIALAGPRFSGKTTLFAAVTGLPLDPAKAAAITGVLSRVNVPDPRLDRLAEVLKPKKHTFAQLDLLDFPGIDLGETSEHKRQLLAQLREMDALVLVVGAYAEGESLAKAAGMVDAVRTEFFFSDLDILEKRIEKLKASVTRPTKTQELEKKELALLERLRAEAERRETLAGIALDANEEKFLRGFAFLSQKPMRVVLNEKDVPPSELPPDVQSKCPGALRLSAKLEQEIAELPSEERAPFMKELGLVEPAGPRLIRSIYALLGLQTFFTTAGDECRAWTIRKGDNAVTAAGKVHNDMAAGFIRAEVYPFDDFMSHGSEKALRSKGLIRAEGRDYLVKDGDILHILFNVSGR